MFAVKQTVRVLSVVPFVLLAACGDGWEKQDYHEVPYTLERTAGTGVAFVRAKMLPARGPSVAQDAPVETVGAQEMKTDLNTALYLEAEENLELPVKDGDEMFDDSQRK